MLLALLVHTLALVQFGGKGACVNKPRPFANVLVTVRGSVDDEFVARRVDEARRAVRVMLGPRARPALASKDADADAVEVNIRREEDHETASLSISVTMAAAL